MWTFCQYPICDIGQGSKRGVYTLLKLDLHPLPGSVFGGGPSSLKKAYRGIREEIVIKTDMLQKLN